MICLIFRWLRYSATDRCKLSLRPDEVWTIAKKVQVRKGLSEPEFLEAV
jgi:hypothetical protein